jgi:hypothetical protein
MTSQNPQPTARLRSAQRAMLGAVAVFLLTTVHHLYGAYIYKTAWRRHAGIVSGLAMALSVGALAVWRRRPTGVAGTIARWTFTLVTLVIQVAGFGLFEGGYNHLAKDTLYFTGAPQTVRRRLFPPPTYEEPNNVFFEVTGVLQLIPALITAYYLYRLVRQREQEERRVAMAGPSAPWRG